MDIFRVFQRSFGRLLGLVLATCLAVGLAGGLTACSSMPLASLARLAVAPETRILESRPADLAVSLRVDQRLGLQPEEAPVLRLALRPREEGGFVPVNESLAMVATVLPGPGPAGDGHKWLSFVLAAADQEKLTQFQARFSGLRQEKKRGSLSVGVSFRLTPGRPRELENLPVETWLRMSPQEGFLKVWSGSPAQLRDAIAREAYP